MWTAMHRRIYRREGNEYPSDLQDAEWARLEPLIPPARPSGQPRKTDLRAAMNAILYLLRTGWSNDVEGERVPLLPILVGLLERGGIEGIPVTDGRVHAPLDPHVER